LDATSSGNIPQSPDKAKVEIEPFSLGELRNPATSRNERQRAANLSFSAC
jgi:hypothetical protein